MALMNSETAKKLLPLVNTPGFQEAVDLYVAERLKVYHKNFERATDVQTFYKLQGNIEATRDIGSLRDSVLSSAGRGK